MPPPKTYKVDVNDKDYNAIPGFFDKHLELEELLELINSPPAKTQAIFVYVNDQHHFFVVYPRLDSDGRYFSPVSNEWPQAIEAYELVKSFFE